MLYRAGECGIYDSHQQAVDVWFEAWDEQEATKRLSDLLCIAWGVDENQLYWTRIWSELQLERDSCEPVTAGSRRWYQGGSWYRGGSRSDLPLYYPFPELVMVRHSTLIQLCEAKASAKMHAREIAADLGRELTELADDGQSDRTRELRRFQTKYASFSEQPPTFARVRRPFAVPSGQDVRRLREKYQLTQADAADLVHVTPNAWQKWEQGVRRMDRRTWELLLYKLHEEYL